jgi:hypothetical protein
MHRRFPSTYLLFRVGAGDPHPRARILNALGSLRLPVELVDESGTTPHGRRRPRDPQSAEQIARARGPRVRERDTRVRITRGEVANVQRLSREESGGRFTIPRTLALEVLEGRLSLPEALQEGERRYPRSRSGRPPLEPRPREPY